MRRMMIGILAAGLLAGCAATDVKMPNEEAGYSYILVFTVPKNTKLRQNPQKDQYIDCSGDCTPHHNQRGTIDSFAVMAVSTERTVPLANGMYSPQWHEPDLAKAQKDAECLLRYLEAGKYEKAGKVEISSAHLIRVAAPPTMRKDASNTPDKEDRCVWP